MLYVISSPTLITPTHPGDLDFDAEGYVYAILSCVLQALYLVLTSVNSDLGLDTFCMQ